MVERAFDLGTWDHLVLPLTIPDKHMRLHIADIACFITAELIGGWHGFGSEVHYNDLQNYTLGHDFPKYDDATGEVSCHAKVNI